MFTSLREIIHQSTTVVGVIDFGQSRPCICSPGLTNHQQVTLSNYEVWYYGLGDYDASAGPRACQLSELDFHFSCLFVCTIGWQPGCAHFSRLIRKKKIFVSGSLHWLSFNFPFLHLPQKSFKFEHYWETFGGDKYILGFKQNRSMRAPRGSSLTRLISHWGGEGTLHLLTLSLTSHTDTNADTNTYTNTIQILIEVKHLGKGS